MRWCSSGFQMFKLQLDSKQGIFDRVFGFTVIALPPMGYFERAIYVCLVKCKYKAYGTLIPHWSR